MQAELVKSFHFEAAHTLPNVPAGHKCGRLHGHSYRIDIHIVGEIDPQTGWVMDFGDLKQAVEPVLEKLDHAFLNDVPGLVNSTSEMMAKYIFDRVKPALKLLTAVVIWESTSSRCIYRGE